MLFSFQQMQPAVLSCGRVSREPLEEKNLWAEASLLLAHMCSTEGVRTHLPVAAVCISCSGKPEAWTSVEVSSGVDEDAWGWAESGRQRGLPDLNMSICTPTDLARYSSLESRSPSLMSSSRKAVSRRRGPGATEPLLQRAQPTPSRERKKLGTMMTLAATGEMELNQPLFKN